MENENNLDEISEKADLEKTKDEELAKYSIDNDDYESNDQHNLDEIIEKIDLEKTKNEELELKRQAMSYKLGSLTNQLIELAKYSPVDDDEYL